MGHIGVKGLLRAVEGIKADDSTYTSCSVCARANIKRSPFPKRSSHRASRLLQRIHCDIAGPLPTCYGNYSYYILFIDCYSRYISLFFMKTRDEALDYFIEFLTLAENFTNERVTSLRVDNAPELTRGKMESYCTTKGISYEKTIPHSPAQNGVAERSNLTLASMARAMLIDADLSDYFWPFATQAAVHIKNRTPHTALPPDHTPFQFWHHYKPNLSHLRLFGSPCTSRVLSNTLSKFDARGESGRFLGYPKDAKGYLLWIPAPNGRGGSVKTRRDVTFHDLPIPISTPDVRDRYSPLWDDIMFPEHLVTSYVPKTVTHPYQKTHKPYFKKSTINGTTPSALTRVRGHTRRPCTIIYRVRLHSTKHTFFVQPRSKICPYSRT
jgi:hypothetical protein